MLPGIDTDGAGSVTGDVDHGAAHVQDPVDTGHQCDAFQRQANALQHHGQHDHAGAGNTGGADGGQGGGEDDGHLLGQGQVDTEDLGNENGADTLVDSGAVHVDGSAQRQNECCGIDIMEMVKQMTGGRVNVGPGTLYNLLEQFNDEQIIKFTKTVGKKRSYILTDKGRQLLEKEYNRLLQLTNDYQKYAKGE